VTTEAPYLDAAEAVDLVLRFLSVGGLTGRERPIGAEIVARASRLDASWMNRHGVPTVTLGGGQRNVHTRNEWLDVPDYLAACRLTAALACG
jgi:acetylornithine deacetylase/succinyl-diaminopimelate desuccinylase-like protein